MTAESLAEQALRAANAEIRTLRHERAAAHRSLRAADETIADVRTYCKLVVARENQMDDADVVGGQIVAETILRKIGEG